MYIYITFAVLSLVGHIVSGEYTKEPPKDLEQAKSTLKTPTVETSTSAAPPNTLNHGSLWDKTPASHWSNQPEVWGGNIKRYEMLLKAPHSLTKLAKTLSLGFDPSFNKDYFEPFERRLRPVTLVAFRKKGYALRHSIKDFANPITSSLCSKNVSAEQRKQGNVSSTVGSIEKFSGSSGVAEQQSPFNEISGFWQNDELAA